MKASSRIRRKVKFGLFLPLIGLVAVAVGSLLLVRSMNRVEDSYRASLLAVTRQKAHVSEAVYLLLQDTQFHSKNAHLEKLEKIHAITDQLKVLDQELIHPSLNTFGVGASIIEAYTLGPSNVHDHVIHLIALLEKISEAIRSGKGHHLRLRDQAVRDSEKILVSMSSLSRKLTRQLGRISFRLDLVLMGGLLILIFFTVLIINYVFTPLVEAFVKQYRERKKSHYLLEETQKNNEVGTWEYDCSTGDVKWSSHIYEIFDLDSGIPVSHQKELEYYVEHDRQLLVKAIEACTFYGEPIDLELNITTANRHNKWISLAAQYVEEGPEKGKILGIFKDITSRKSAENRFEILFNNSDSPFFIIDNNLKIVECNWQSVTFLGGLSKEDIKLLPMAAFSPIYQLDGKSSLDKLKNVFEASDEKGEIRFEYHFKGVDGEELPADVRIVPLEFKNKIMHLMICRDHSEKYEYERRLIQANSKAQRAIRLRSELLFTFNSEFQTPLDDLSMHFRELKEAKLPEALFRNVQVIEKDIKNLHDLLENLSALGRYESQAINIDYGPFRGSELVKTCVDFARQKMVGKEVELSCHMDSELESLFWGDSMRIRQVLVQVLDNAVKFTSRGEVHFSSRCEKINNSQSKIIFQIVDSGPGLDESIRNNLFRSLEMSERMQLIKEGRRLGLLLVKSLVDLLGGEINVINNKNKGATFTFSIVLDLKDMQSPAIKPEEGRLISSADTTLIDFSVLKEQYRGEEDVLLNIIEDYLKFCPGIIKDLQEAVAEQDGHKLEIAASSFYGVIGHFNAAHLMDFAIELEKMGRFHNFKNAVSTLSQFETELDRFNKLLKDLNLSDLVA